jgi:hypothetical protein
MEAQKHSSTAGASESPQQTFTPYHATNNMSAQCGYFATRPMPISPRPEHIFLAQVAGRAGHKRNTSTDSVVSNHSSFLRPNSFHLDTSPTQRAISFSSWTRYKPSAPCSPSGKLEASLLCKASGTTERYDPPASEWTFLGAEQPVYTNKLFVRTNLHQWGQDKGSSSTLSEMSLPVDVDEWLFTKQPVKRVSTSSQLTASIKGSIIGGCAISTAKKYGLEGMTCEDLPSAFDDSDEEED